MSVYIMSLPVHKGFLWFSGDSCAGQAAVPVNLIMLGSNLSKGADFGALPVGRSSADGELERGEKENNLSEMNVFPLFTCRCASTQGNKQVRRHLSMETVTMERVSKGIVPITINELSRIFIS